jgi:hypothetical protein
MTSSDIQWYSCLGKQKRGREERKFHLQCDSAGRIGPACGELHAGTKLPVQYNTGNTGTGGVYHIGMPNVTTLLHHCACGTCLASLYVLFSLSPSLNLT